MENSSCSKGACSKSAQNKNIFKVLIFREWEWPCYEIIANNFYFLFREIDFELFLPEAIPFRIEPAAPFGARPEWKSYLSMLIATRLKIDDVLHVTSIAI